MFFLVGFDVRPRFLVEPSAVGSSSAASHRSGWSVFSAAAASGRREAGRAVQGKFEKSV